MGQSQWNVEQENKDRKSVYSRARSSQCGAGGGCEEGGAVV